jgi:UDP-N-acetylglucosamine transferase subunit ALG13
MIFLTVGTQLPFDRLVSAVDKWAAQHSDVKLVAQVGDSGLRPKQLDWTPYMAAQKFRTYFEAADTIVAHAGMGTILTALDLGKQLIIVPRLAELGEHRNDHQLATAEKFKHFPLVHVVSDMAYLGNALEDAQKAPASINLNSGASNELIEAIRSFIAFPSENDFNSATRA